MRIENGVITIDELTPGKSNEHVKKNFLKRISCW